MRGGAGGSGDGLETTATTEKADIGQRRSYGSHADISATMTSPLGQEETKAAD